MSSRILKFQLSNIGLNYVHMPKGAKFLKAAYQHGAVTVWAMCNADADHSIGTKSLFVVGTGSEFDGQGDYIGSCVSDGFVWHVFDRTNIHG